MKPRHKKPSKKELGMPSIPFFDLFKKTDHSHQQDKAVIHNHGTEPPKDVPIYTLAVVLDGQVYEVLRAQSVLADIFLSKPDFVLVDDVTGKAKIGMEYKDGKFREKQ